MTELSSRSHLHVIARSVMVVPVRILIIEDEPRILGFLARGLESEGFAVDTVDNGTDGLRHLRGNVYDLVLLDLLLPGIDGLAVLQEVSSEQPDLPVMVVSARSDLPT